MGLAAERPKASSTFCPRFLSLGGVHPGPPVEGGVWGVMSSSGDEGARSDASHFGPDETLQMLLPALSQALGDHMMGGRGEGGACLTHEVPVSKWALFC